MNTPIDGKQTMDTNMITNVPQHNYTETPTEDTQIIIEPGIDGEIDDDDEDHLMGTPGKLCEGSTLETANKNKTIKNNNTNNMDEIESDNVMNRETPGFSVVTAGQTDDGNNNERFDDGAV